jgi:hypothetical protein
MELKIVVLSKGRPARVTTKNVVKIDAIVCPKNEVDDYKKYNPKIEIIAQPDGVNNIVKARQFVLNTFEEVFMLDDDVTHVGRFFASSGEEFKVNSKEHVKDIIMQTASLARQMDAKMFGFTHLRQPVCYHSQKPFRMTGFLNASHCGFLKGHQIKYDERMNEGEDHFASLYNVFKNRYMLINDRYGFFTTANFKSDGGCSLDRNTDSMKKNTLMLREMFGEAVSIKTANIQRKNINEGERSLSFPF